MYGYDAWGNLTNVTVTQGTAHSLNVSVNGNNQMVGDTYDNAGNMLYDGANTYTWDGEGRQKSVSGPTGSATYVYDGDGQRVEKRE